MLIHYGMSRKIVFSLCVLLCGALIALNGEAAEAARSGFALWQNSVMPALLPFFVCTGLMRKLGLISLGNPAALMALSFISGAPGGARLCAGIYGDSTQDNTVMAASLNALSPMFITGAFASSMLRCPQAAIYALRRLSPSDIAALPDVAEGLENAICSACRESSGFAELTMNIKSKRYTLSRIRRI